MFHWYYIAYDNLPPPFISIAPVIPEPSSCSAEQILDHFRDQFIDEMDADAVVLELLHKQIIDRGDQKTITRTANPTQQNGFLHLYLKEKCTNKAFAFKTVCDIIIAVKGNPRMNALGKAMKNMLETG